MLFLLMVCLNAMAVRAEEVTINGIIYELDREAGTAVLTNGSTASGMVCIPNEVEGCKVIRIGDNAFRDCNSLTTVRLCYDESGMWVEPNLTSIGGYAFSGCSALEFFDFPDCLESIENGAFADCSALVEVRLPWEMTSLGAYAFSGCSALEVISLPFALKTLEMGLFRDCVSLKEVNLYDPLERIEQEVFMGCVALESLYIPASLTHIVYGVANGTFGAFAGCESLREFIVSEENNTFASIDGVLFNKDKTTLLLYPNAHGATYSVPAGVTRIENTAFQGCYSLTNITFPVGLTSIGEAAFERCTSLESLVLPAGLVRVEPTAFLTCTSMKSLVLPESLEVIEEAVFGGCTSLTDITFPSGLKRIEGRAFRRCLSLTDVALPSGVESIGYSAFEQCAFTNILLPQSLKTLGDFAFSYCASLERLALPASVEKVGSGLFVWCKSLQEITVPEENKYYTSLDGVLYDKAKTKLVAFPLARAGAYAVPNGVESIEDYAFSNCVALTAVSFPESLTVIGNQTFGGCTSLADITFSEGLKTLDFYAFGYCTSLTKISLPESLTTVAYNAFEGCTSLTLCHLYNKVVFRSSESVRVYVPNGRGELETYYGESFGGYFVPVFIGLSGYSTYYCSKAAKLPEGATGYVVTGVDEENCLQLVEAYRAGDIVPAGEALLLKGSLPKTTVDVEATNVGTPVAGNWLRGSDTAEMIPAVPGECYYKLSYDLVTGEKLGFFWGAENAGPFVNAAHKAYLAVPASYATATEGFSLDDSSTTGVGNVVADGQKAKTVYTLDGRRVDATDSKPLPAGIYVVNGKKVVVK